jgi:RNA polymerase sigma factor (sigma-70 family)
LTTRSSSDALLAETIREESGRLVARLTRLLGDFDVAEEAVQEAVLEALTAWRRNPPANPAAWLTLAARRNALDQLRARGRSARRLDAMANEPALAPDGSPNEPATALDATPDERVGLLFACCHPALPADARVALTLRAVVGLTTPQIARAFLLNEVTLAQRIVRAKRKIVATGIRLQVPDPAELPARLADVLRVVYLAYSEAYVSSEGPGHDRDLGADAVWLAGSLASALPDQAEAWGLLALLTVQHGRAGARLDATGSLVPLRDQHRSRWNPQALQSAQHALARAAALHRTGPYQLQAAIATLHAEAPTWEATDWGQIATLYAALRQLDDTPVVRLNEAIAVSFLRPDRVEHVLADLDALADRLGEYHLWHATRAEMLRRLGRTAEAHEATRRALSLTDNEAERRLLITRLHRQSVDDIP